MSLFEKSPLTPTLPLSINQYTFLILGSFLGLSSYISFKKSKLYNLSPFVHFSSIIDSNDKETIEDQPISVHGYAKHMLDYKGNRLLDTILTKHTILLNSNQDYSLLENSEEDDSSIRNTHSTSNDDLTEYIEQKTIHNSKELCSYNETQPFLLQTYGHDLVIYPEYSILVSLEKGFSCTMTSTLKQKYSELIPQKYMKDTLILQDYILNPDTEIFIYGYISKQGDQYILQGTKNQPLLISIEDQYKKQRNYRYLSIFFGVTSIFFYSFCFFYSYLKK